MHVCSQTHTYLPTYLPLTYIHTYIHTYKDTSVHTYIRTYIFAYIHIYSHIHTYLHACTHAYMCVCVCVCAAIHTYTHQEHASILLSPWLLLLLVLRLLLAYLARSKLLLCGFEAYSTRSKLMLYDLGFTPQDPNSCCMDCMHMEVLKAYSTRSKLMLYGFLRTTQQDPNSIFLWTVKDSNECKLVVYELRGASVGLPNKIQTGVWRFQRPTQQDPNSCCIDCTKVF